MELDGTDPMGKSDAEASVQTLIQQRLSVGTLMIRVELASRSVVDTYAILCMPSQQGILGLLVVLLACWVDRYRGPY